MSSRKQYNAAQQHEWERAAGVQLGRCERAEALVARYRAALEQIAQCPCDELNGCSWIGPYDGCRTCIACAALEEKP